MRKTTLRLCFGLSSYGHTHNGSLTAGTKTGIPFYGNMYQGRVNPDDYQPSQYSTQEEARQALLSYKKIYADDDPYIRAKLDKCPYFALSDMVVWQGMAPTFLDPGLLTAEEHHLLLLFSRAYYEKWAEIHSNPREVAPKPRIKKGKFKMTEKILRWAGCNEDQIKRARDMLVDDASLIGMNPKCWGSAHLDEKVRDHLTGRCLEFSGLTETQMKSIFELLDRMRTIVVRRKDQRNFDNVKSLTGIVDTTAPPVRDLPASDDFITITYAEAYTLYNLYKVLGLQSYSGQLKVLSYVDRLGTPLTITLNNEDDYFDFLVANFYKANIEIIDGSTSPFVITVMEQTRAQAALGKWF